MGARGKESGASLTVIRSSGVTALERAAPPGYLTDDQAEVWVRLVNRMPAEWFQDETIDLLAQYCRHSVNAKRIDGLIENLVRGDTGSDDWVAEYDRLLKMQDREGRALSSLATRMRITQHSQYDKKKKRGSAVQKPHLT